MPSSKATGRRARLRRAAATALLAAPLVAAAAGGCAARVPPLPPAAAPAPPGPTLPERLGDAEFWALVSDVSEPGGYFRIEDNYTSNEMEVGQLATMLRQARVAGGVYLGVGPEQNFTYIAAIRPRLAFVVDIRRQAVMQHLMYKALFEMAPDRGEFVSLLFARPRPAGIDGGTPIQTLWDRFATVGSDTALAARTRARVVERLTATHGFRFTPEESVQLRSVLDAFVRYGPAIATRGVRTGWGSNRGFAELTGASLDSAGRPQSFLSTEENYRFVRSLHERNLVVPVSGDFAGPKAIHRIGAYVREHGGTVRAFYVSNVEQYLFQGGKDRAFYENVAALPVDTGSVFIRPYSMRRGAWSGAPTRSLCPIGAFLRAAQGGRVASNDDALACAP